MKKTKTTTQTKIWIVHLTTQSLDHCYYSFAYKPSTKDIVNHIEKVGELSILAETKRELSNHIRDGIISVETEETVLITK